MPKGKRYKVNQVDTKAFAFVTPDQLERSSMLCKRCVASFTLLKREKKKSDAFLFINFLKLRSIVILLISYMYQDHNTSMS